MSPNRVAYAGMCHRTKTHIEYISVLQYFNTVPRKGQYKPKFNFLKTVTLFRKTLYAVSPHETDHCSTNMRLKKCISPLKQQKPTRYNIFVGFIYHNFDALLLFFTFPYDTCSVGPVGPVGPVAPVTLKPMGPWGPVAPVAPVAPVGPVTPVAPVAPVTLIPMGPVAPVAPVGPMGPCGPCGPVGPVMLKPCGPCGPGTPCGPRAPWIPLGPCAPAGPWGPCGPCGP